MVEYKPSKADYLWNMLGCLASAVASLVLVVGVTRIMGAVAGGIFSIAFSLGQLLMMLGNMGLRTFQVSDLEERFTMAEYVINRSISCVLMILCAICYCTISDCDTQKIVIILLIVGAKMVDAFADVFEGQLQKEHRLDLAGFSMTVRMGISMMSCLGILWFTHDLIIACVCMFISSVVCTVLFSIMPGIRIHAQFGRSVRHGFVWRQTISLFYPALPLFFSSFGLMMIASMPKYAIDFLLPEASQAIYSILYLPAQVISLLSNFIFKPLISEMAYDWQNGDISQFAARIRNLLTFIIIGTIVILIPCWYLGAWILSLLSGLDLSAYRLDLILLISGGAFTAAAALLFQAITIMRRQVTAFGIYFIVTILSVILDLQLIRAQGLIGASLGFLIQTFILAASLFTVYTICCTNANAAKRKTKTPTDKLE